MRHLKALQFSPGGKKGDLVEIHVMSDDVIVGRLGRGIIGKGEEDWEKVRILCGNLEVEDNWTCVSRENKRRLYEDGLMLNGWKRAGRYDLRRKVGCAVGCVLVPRGISCELCGRKKTVRCRC